LIITYLYIYVWYDDVTHMRKEKETNLVEWLMASKELDKSSVHTELVRFCRSRMIWKDHINMYHLVSHTSVDDDYTMYNEDVYICSINVCVRVCVWYIRMNGELYWLDHSFLFLGALEKKRKYCITIESILWYFIKSKVATTDRQMRN
jgi:hypothetical protein